MTASAPFRPNHCSWFEAMSDSEGSSARKTAFRSSPSALARLVDRARDRHPDSRPASARELRASQLDLETRPASSSRTR